MKHFFIIILTVLMSLDAISAFAHDIEVKCDDGKSIYFVWTNNKTELAVSYGGTSKYGGYYSGNIVIPESVEYNGKTYSVTAIGWHAFHNCRNLTSVTIPNSVKSIVEDAFTNCVGLTSIAIPSSVTYIQNAFDGCRNLYSVHITDLEAWCNIDFSGMGIARHLYLNGEEIKNLVIPSGITSIKAGAFQGCSITSVTIPNSVTSIEYSAFSGCSDLTSVTIPNSVTSIGNTAFAYCSGLTSIIVENGNPNYDSRNGCNAIIDSNNQLIVGGRNTIIPNSVTSIGDYAFSGCTGLTSIDIPDNVTAIGSSAFCHCTNLVYITLPRNIASIDGLAFGYCNSLTDVYCKAENVPSASSNSFSNPGNITLYAPSASHNAYKSTEPWSKFKAYNSLINIDIQATEKCSKPTISVANGKAIFSCESSGVTYHWSISTPICTTGTNNISINLPITLNVYATKDGYQNSDVATYEFSGLVGDVDGNGVVNVSDHVELSRIIMGQ